MSGINQLHLISSLFPIRLTQCSYLKVVFFTWILHLANSLSVEVLYATWRFGLVPLVYYVPLIVINSRTSLVTLLSTFTQTSSPPQSSTLHLPWTKWNSYSNSTSGDNCAGKTNSPDTPNWILQKNSVHGLLNFQASSFFHTAWLPHLPRALPHVFLNRMQIQDGESSCLLSFTDIDTHMSVASAHFCDMTSSFSKECIYEFTIALLYFGYTDCS